MPQRFIGISFYSTEELDWYSEKILGLMSGWKSGGKSDADRIKIASAYLATLLLAFAAQKLGGLVWEGIVSSFPTHSFWLRRLFHRFYE